MFRKLRLLLLLLLAAVYSGYAQVPVAAITATPKSGCAPLAVSLNGAATNSPTSWSWTIPGGAPASSILQNTASVFNTPGTYIVTLVATNASGSSVPVTETITVNPVPIANFTPDKTTGCFPTTINFTNTSTAGAGATFTSWTWDFGDGNLDNTNFNTSHTYTTANIFPVVLAVYNNFGCKGKSQVNSNNITITNGITSAFTPSLNSSCTLPVVASFSNQTIGPGTLTYTWNFGDGSGWQTGLPTSPTHNYAVAGTDIVQLAVTSSLGCADTANSPVTISASGSLSDFTGWGNVCINTLATFPNTSSPPPSSATWDYGDGTGIFNTIIGQHTFTAPGVYHVTLTNTFAGCTGTVTHDVTVVNSTNTVFTGTNLNSCAPPLTTQFTDQTVGATSWLWNFGDGFTSTLPNPAHTYNSYGNFQVSLTTSSAPGCSNTLTQAAFVNIAMPTVAISNANANGCAPYVYTPVVTVSAVDGVASYSWDMGNGFLFNGQTPPPQTYGPGNYTVKLKITTNGGCTATATVNLKVGTIQPATAFTAVPTSACKNQFIQFTDLTPAGTANQWLWDFGDGNTSAAQDTLYRYSKPGTYDVSLTAYNNGCFLKVTKPAYITINPPSADFNYAFACGAKTNYSFTDNSNGATTWDWDFGDGTLPHSHVPNPTHTYSTMVPMVYNVALIVTNGSCADTITKPVSVNQSTTINPIPLPVCNNSLVTIFTTAPGNIVSYLFDFGDGSPLQGSGSGATSHTYPTPGNYSITVQTTDNNGCVETSVPYILQVSGPTVKFTTPTQISCGPLAANFTDQSVAAPGTNLATWSWNFGDGNTGTGPNPSHNYNLQGIYQVMEKVTDNNGCSDSLIQPNYITVSTPAASFTTPSVNYCPSSFIKFNNTSTGGYSPVYTWDFKDGTNYPGTNPPLHNYPLVGKYPVSLTITDAYNCTSTYTAPIPINVDTPSATFAMSASYSACPPLNEQFTFTGHYDSLLTWTFDNGASAFNNPTPGTIYAFAGDYYPKLIVTSFGGCIATFSDHIHIDGPVGSFTYSPLAACDSLDVNFLFTTSNVVSFTWNFGDGSSLQTLTPTTTHHYNMPGSWYPFVTIVDAAGCKVNYIGTNAVEIDSISQTAFIVDKNILCDSGTVNFTNTVLVPIGVNITNYSWDFGDGTSVKSGMFPTIPHDYAGVGNYNPTLTITTLGGCTGTASIPITVAASPQVAINGLLNQCEPAILNFSGMETVPDPNGPLTWSWSFGNGQTATGQSPAPVSYPKAGEYVVQLIATNTKGCSDTTNTSTPNHLFIYPIPTVNAGADTTICLGSPLQLNASGNATTYNWLPPVAPGTLSCLPCANPVANSPSSTYFVVNGTSLNGCTANDTIQVTVNVPPVVNVSGPDSVCLGQSVQMNATGAALYNWNPSEGLNNPNIANPTATPDASQVGAAPSTVINYQVTGYDSKKCFSDTKSVNITAFNYPVISLVPNATINVGSSYQISASATTNIVSLNWTPSNSLSCSNCLTPLATPTSTTKYDLTAVNDGGCASSDSIRIQVICNGANFFVPNSFSPNGDGVNDHFIVNGVGLNVIPSITIYNRWGQIVFQKSNFAPNSAADAWDGTFNGQPAPADVYVYTIQILCNNATLIPYHGNVTLIR